MRWVGWGPVLNLVACGYGHNLFDCGEPGENFAYAIFPHGAHAITPRLLAQADGGNVVVNHGANAIVDEEDFEEAQPAAVAGAMAGRTTGAAAEFSPVQCGGI